PCAAYSRRWPWRSRNCRHDPRLEDSSIQEWITGNCRLVDRLFNRLVLGIFRSGIIGLETLSDDPFARGPAVPSMLPCEHDLTELRQVFQPTEQLEVSMCSPH